jgi:hypothetical protein
LSHHKIIRAHSAWNTWSSLVELVAVALVAVELVDTEPAHSRHLVRQITQSQSAQAELRAQVATIQYSTQSHQLVVAQVETIPIRQ